MHAAPPQRHWIPPAQHAELWLLYIHVQGLHQDVYQPGTLMEFAYSGKLGRCVLLSWKIRKCGKWRIQNQARGKECELLELFQDMYGQLQNSTEQEI